MGDDEQLQINLDIANTLRDEVIPYHLEYFLGVREDEEFGGFEDMDDMGDEDMDDMGDDDDEDEAPKVRGEDELC